MPAGITLTLPKRILALESLIEFSDASGRPLPIRAEISLCPDKNKPQLKTAATFRFDVNGNEKQAESIAIITFSHPKLGKVSKSMSSNWLIVRHYVKDRKSGTTEPLPP